MKLLLCCEFYFPSIGGVQEVVRQIAERMVTRGHDVTVATSKLAERTFSELNGVKIEEFAVSGNIVNGLKGEADRYREFVKKFHADAILIKAAQQWTFDALWPVLDEIKSRKVFIPCGFSALYEPDYVAYYAEMPAILGRFDHLIFYAENYRDLEFTKKHGFTHWTIVPNGASEKEFMYGGAGEFRKRYGLDEDGFVFLTVGSMTGAKGHKEVAEAFYRMIPDGQPMALILNGNQPPWMVGGVELGTSKLRDNSDGTGYQRLLRRLSEVYGGITKVLSYPYKVVRIFLVEGYDGVYSRAHKIVVKVLRRSIFGNMRWVRGLESFNTLGYWVRKIRKQDKGKSVLVVDLPRNELIQAYFAADLFVFASNVEYSPLVLFETVAAGTPFLSVPVGNAEEIAQWTSGGTICPAKKDKRGYTRVEPRTLAREMKEASMRRAELVQQGAVARELWKEKFTWDVIAHQYERILTGDANACISSAAGM
jgi:glycosyltransferase involved in cell wall biosynthesis